MAEAKRRAGWRPWALPLGVVGAAATLHFIVHVPHGPYELREPAASDHDDDREREVFDAEKVLDEFVAEYEPILQRAYDVGYEAANSGAATPEIHEVELECRTMRCRLRLCGARVGVNMVLRHVQNVKHGPHRRLFSVFERGPREPQLEGNAVCVDTIVRFAVRDPNADALRG